MRLTRRFILVRIAASPRIGAAFIAAIPREAPRRPLCFRLHTGQIEGYVGGPGPGRVVEQTLDLLLGPLRGVLRVPEIRAAHRDSTHEKGRERLQLHGSGSDLTIAPSICYFSVTRPLQPRIE